MKMIPGTGTVLDYGLYISNCQTQQRKYKIPVQGLLDVQLYIDFGPDDPGDTAAINLVYTCGALAGTTVPLTPVKYVIGQDPDDNFYGVFQGFNETIEAASFVIAIEFGDVTYFSEEYEIDTGCSVSPLKLVKGCYGNLDPEISFDGEGIYFGQSQGSTLGDASTVYEHKFLMRDVEISINAIKNNFQQGKTRTFRTESVHVFLFWGEFIPGWYLEHIDGVFRRGEVYIGNPDEENPQKWLVDSTPYEQLDDCTQCWRPSVLLKRNKDNSFSCEEDPCTVVVDEGGGGETPTCCNPTVNSAVVDGFDIEGGNTVCLDFNPCSPTPANGWVIRYRVQGSGGAFSTITGVTSSPFCFGAGGEDGDQFEGFIYSDCGDTTGSQIPWSTGTTPVVTINRTNSCGTNFSNFEITGNPGDTVVVRASFGGTMTRNPSWAMVMADLFLNTDDGSPTNGNDFECYTDASFHGFGPLVLTTTVILDGAGTAQVTTLATIHNSISGVGSLTVEVIEVNGDAVLIQAPGCVGNSSTGGTCP